MFRGTRFRRLARGSTSGGGISNPIPGLSPVAYFKFNTGITVTGSGVSKWADQSGNGNDLLQGTDASRPPKQGDGTILFNGTSQFLMTAGFTLNQPFTICMAFRQVTWTDQDKIFDGVSANSTLIYQNSATPQLNIYAGSAAVAGNTALAVNTYGALAAVFNGASSVLQINNTTQTGSPGAQNAGGITLGAVGGGGSGQANIQVKEMAAFPTALDAATRASVIAYLNTL